VDTSTRIPMPAQGGAIPVLGFGMWQIPPGKTAQRACEQALACGYRHIDTARYYNNEQDAGHALRASGLPRDEIFITTKLRNPDHGYDAALRACEASLLRLGLDCLDLYLIHWPVPRLRADSWEALVALKERGLCRAIGVSNYTERHLEELRAESDVTPAVNQVELHVFLSQPSLRSYCERRGIVVTAYSPLTSGKRLDDPTVAAIAKKHGRSPAQVMIRFCIEHGLVVLPRSQNEGRIRANADVFDFALDADDMRRLDALDEGFRTCWDPTDEP